MSRPLAIDGDASGFQISIDALLQDALQSIRTHLGMDVAFISEFVDGQRTFRYVDAGPLPAPIQVGQADPLEETYCQLVASGLLPQLILDAAQISLARSIPATTALPIGAHVSIPIQFSDGRIYGSFCCFKHAPDATLRERDRVLVQAFAAFAGKQLERQVVARRAEQEMAERIEAAIAQRAVTPVYQPIYHLGDHRIVGFEALSRFSAMPIRPPNIWFDEAAQVGRSAELEEIALGRAIEGLAQLPRHIYLALNVSPATIASDVIPRLLAATPLDQIVLEITEHDAVADYGRLAEVLAPLRQRGLRLAVDDAGAGYASLRHILRIAPDMVKLDISLTRGIDRDRSQRALTAALVRFAEEIGSRLIAEGVETEAELAELRRLRVTKAQGYLIGRPMPLASAVALAQASGAGDTPRAREAAT